MCENCVKVKFQGTQMKLDWSRAEAPGQSQSLQWVMWPEKSKVFLVGFDFYLSDSLQSKAFGPCWRLLRAGRKVFKGEPPPWGLRWAPVIPAESQSQQHSKFKFKASLGCWRLSLKPKLNKCLSLSVLFVCLLFACLYCLLFFYLGKPWNEMRGSRCPVRFPPWAFVTCDQLNLALKDHP